MLRQRVDRIGTSVVLGHSLWPHSVHRTYMGLRRSCTQTMWWWRQNLGRRIDPWAFTAALGR